MCEYPGTVPDTGYKCTPRDTSDAKGGALGAWERKCTFLNFIFVPGTRVPVYLVRTKGAALVNCTAPSSLKTAA